MLLTEAEALNFAGGRHGELLDKSNLPGNLEPRQPALAEFLNRVRPGLLD